VEQLVGDVGARRGIGRGGERDDLAHAQRFAQRTQPQMVRTEVVAPLGNAVRLVDGDTPHAGGA